MKISLLQDGRKFKYYAWAEGTVLGDIPTIGNLTSPPIKLTDNNKPGSINVYFADGKYFFTKGVGNHYKTGEKFISPEENEKLKLYLKFTKDEILSVILNSLEEKAIVLKRNWEGIIEHSIYRKNGTYMECRQNCFSDTCNCISHPRYIDYNLTKDDVIRIIISLYKLNELD